MQQTPQPTSATHLFCCPLPRERTVRVRGSVLLFGTFLWQRGECLVEVLWEGKLYACCYLIWKSHCQSSVPCTWGRKRALQRIKGNQMPAGVVSICGARPKSRQQMYALLLLLPAQDGCASRRRLTKRCLECASLGCFGDAVQMTLIPVVLLHHSAHPHMFSFSAGGNSIC